MNVSAILSELLTGIEEGISGLVIGVLAIFMPKLSELSEDAIQKIGINFRTFMTAIDNGTPWGQALADMLTADWNDVDEDAKEIATDFAEAVATSLQKVGLIFAK